MTKFNNNNNNNNKRLAAVPRWLRGVSKLYAICCRRKNDQKEDEDEDEEKQEEMTVPLGAPPLCASARSKDLFAIYENMAYWCVNFNDAPEHFVLHWFQHGTAEERAALLERVGAFRSELDEHQWRKNMFMRDDARMLSIFLSHDPLINGVLQLPSDKGMPLTEMAMLCARSNAVRCMDTLIRRFELMVLAFRMRLMRTAAALGNLEVLQLLHTHCGRMRLDELGNVCTFAAAGGSVPVLRHMAHMLQQQQQQQQQHAFSPKCFLNAACNGRLEALQFMRGSAVPVAAKDHCAYAGAILGDRLDVLMWLHRQEWSMGDLDSLMYKAAQVGNRPILLWLVERGAALAGNTEVVYAAIDSTTISDDAELLSFLHWLHKNFGCVAHHAGLAQYTIVDRDRSAEVMQWVLDHRTFDVNFFYMLTYAVTMGRTSLADLAVSRISPLSPMHLKACTYTNEWATAHFLVSRHNCPTDDQTLLVAAVRCATMLQGVPVGKGWTKYMDLLAQKGCLLNYGTLVEIAAKTNNEMLTKWIYCSGRR